MITPKLEQLIWEGKAFFKTYVAGPNKSTLNIDNDRFIIITDIQFSGYGRTYPLTQAPNIQLNIYGEKGFNHYVFRNLKKYFAPVWDGGATVIGDYDMNTDPQTINTYLLHTTAVGFSFLIGDQLTAPTLAVASVSNPSLQPPLDYGKDGDAGALAICTAATSGGTMLNFFTNRANFGLPDNILTAQQLQFPVQLPRPADSTPQLCMANINYVEILGKPENMQF
jgi:hypothetical protein